MAEYTTYEEWQVAVDRMVAQAYAAGGGGLAFDPREASLGVGAVMRDEEDESWEVRQTRIDTFQAVMDFVWQDGPDLIKAMKRLLVITRCGSPTHVLHMDQTEVAVLLNETRSATNARETRVWVEWLEKKGFFGTRTRLHKSDEAKQKYAAKAMGNVSRKGGRAAVRKISVLRQEYAAENAVKPNKTTTKRRAKR
jgi:hypothetical protein